MKTYSTQPLISTWKTPREIVGGSNQFKIFSEIMAVYERCAKNGEIPSSRDLKAFDPAALAALPKILVELRESGFFPGGVDERGDCRFLQMRKGLCQEIYEAGLGALSHHGIEELQSMARAGYSATVRHATVEKIKSHELNAEKHLR